MNLRCRISDITHLTLHALIIILAHVSISLIFPSASSRYGEVIYDSRTVFASCKNISHASMISVKSTQLGYLSFYVLLALIELQMLRCAVYMSLQGTPLLTLRRLGRLVGHLGLQLQWKRLLHTIASLQNLLIRRQFLDPRWVILS